MKSFIFILSLMFCMNAHSNDCVVKNPSMESVSEYLLRIAQTFNALKSHQKEAPAESEEKKESDFTNTMISLKEIKEEYLCVSQVVASYSKSKNKGVAKSSKLLSQGYKDLAANNQHMIETTKSMLNSMSADKIKPGDLADRVSDSEIAKKKAWKKVYEAIDIGIEAVNEKTKPNSKKESNPKYSDEWRNMIIEELKKGFKVPIKDEKDAFDQLANYLFQSVSEPAKSE